MSWRRALSPFRFKPAAALLFCDLPRTRPVILYRSYFQLIYFYSSGKLTATNSSVPILFTHLILGHHLCFLSYDITQLMPVTYEVVSHVFLLPHFLPVLLR